MFAESPGERKKKHRLHLATQAMQRSGVIVKDQVGIDVDASVRNLSDHRMSKRDRYLEEDALILRQEEAHLSLSPFSKKRSLSPGKPLR